MGRACRECGLLVEHRLIPCGLPLQPGQITKVSHGTRSYAKPQPRHSYLFAEALYGTVIRSETTLPQNAPQIAVLDASPIAMLRNHSLDVDARLQGHLSLPDVLPRECEVLVRAQGHCGLPVDDHVEKVHCRLQEGSGVSHGAGRGVNGGRADERTSASQSCLAHCGGGRLC